jgi:hypothetical protein
MDVYYFSVCALSLSLALLVSVINSEQARSYILIPGWRKRMISNINSSQSTQEFL